MGKTGRLYSPEFKEEAIRLVQSCEEKYPVAKIARDLEASPPRRCVSGSTRPRSTPESAMGSPPRRKKSCVACAKR
jgi:transposase-like protein